MSKSDKPDFLGWLGFRRVPSYESAPWLGPILSGLAILVVGSLVVLSLGAAYTLLGGAVFGDLLETEGSSLGVGAVTVALIGAPFVIWRSIVAQKTVNVQEQGLITDRITKAVDGLGAEKTVKRDNEEFTQPNLEVRIGAIYALERIAQDSDRDHVQIMEILCAYIRQNAPAPEIDDWPELEMREGEENGPLEADWSERLEKFHKDQELAEARLKPREDIQVALTVIGRRSAEQRRIEAGPGRGQKAEFPFDIPCPEYDGPEDEHDPKALERYLKKLENWKSSLEAYKRYRLDLRNTDLRGMDMSGLNLAGAKLDGARLQGAGLSEARLQGAVLWCARLQGAYLWGARLDERTNFTAASLRGAAVGDVDFSNIPQITAHLQGMFGDASVTLPGGHGPAHENWPPHWPKFKLAPHTFRQEWRKWQADPEGYPLPDPH